MTRHYRLSLIMYLLFFFFLPAAAFAENQPVLESLDPTGQKIQLRAPEPRVILPGLEFRKITEDKEAGLIYVPFLGEYIAAVYSYAVAAASIIAAIIIVFSGFQWTASGGSQDAIGAAKKRIVGAITGLILAVGSYTILYAVNPELVQFRSLRVKYVNTINLDELLAQKSTLDQEILRDSRGVCKDSKRSACEIAVEADNGAKRVVQRVHSVNGQDPTTSENCPLQGEKKSTITVTPTNKNQPDLNFPGFDSLFQLYGNCLTGVTDGWKVLKAISYTESAHNSSVVNSLGFTGLAQTKADFCQTYLEKYDRTQYCSSLTDPEVGVMVIASSVRGSLKIIQSSCQGQLSPDALNYFIYIGHQSGGKNLPKILKASACDPSKACKATYDTWNAKTIYRDKEAPPCAR